MGVHNPIKIPFKITVGVHDCGISFKTTMGVQDFLPETTMGVHNFHLDWNQVLFLSGSTPYPWGRHTDTATLSSGRA